MNINFEIGRTKIDRKENEYPFDTIQVLVDPVRARQIVNHLNDELSKRTKEITFVLVGSQLK